MHGGSDQMSLRDMGGLLIVYPQVSLNYRHHILIFFGLQYFHHQPDLLISISLLLHVVSYIYIYIYMYKGHICKVIIIYVYIRLYLHMFVY